MHHLHPRSRTTSTLFTTTLAISFLVVGLPHILPCPVDRRQFADGAVEGADGRPLPRRRRVRRKEGEGVAEAEARMDEQSDGDGIGVGRPARECPVPKPGGLVGQIMGFEQREKERPVPVVVQGLRGGRNVKTVKEDESTGGQDGSR